MFDICTGKNKGVNFNLEMITRDPLRIPCLTDEFWETLPVVKAREIASTLRTVKHQGSKTALPEVSHLNDEQRLSAEEQNIITSLRYSRSDLGMS